MAACRGHLQRALRGGLALDVGQVRQTGLGLARQRGGARQGFAVGLQRGHHVQQVPGLAHHEAFHQGRLAGAVGGQQQFLRTARLPQGQGHRQCAAHRAQFAGQRQLTGAFERGEPRGIDLPVGRQQAQGHGQVEPATFLDRRVYICEVIR